MTYESICMRYPTMPCSPGAKPVAMEVNAVAVVVGATLVMRDADMFAMVGASAVRSCN